MKTKNLMNMLITLVLFINVVLVGFSYQSLGNKIVFYAKRFLGTPYDPDPIGAYVRKKTIIYDSEVDCMYLTFRSVELAFGDGNDEKSIDIALDKRFKTKGIVSNGLVYNYEKRFEYGEDMFLSGKWGNLLITNELLLKRVFSERLKMYISYVPKENFNKVKNLILNGSIIFFVKDPKKSKKGEVVGHLGILEKNNGEVYLIHASGYKNRGGKVVRERLKDYLRKTKYIGFVITSFDIPQAF